MYQKQKILLIDLDGVLNEYKGNYNACKIAPIKPGAKKFIRELAKNYKIKIFTAREITLAKEWIIENHLEKFISDVTNKKDSAYLHIDDRCICFKGNFNDTLKDIKNFKVYWKK